jgi:hypothetical protein
MPIAGRPPSTLEALRTIHVHIAISISTMKNKTKKGWAILLLLLLALSPAGCEQRDVAGSAGGCPSATTDTRLLQNEAHGYYFLYPTGYDVVHPNEGETALAVGSLLNVEEPRAYIKVEDAGGRTADQVADKLVAGLPEGLAVDRTSATIGGEQAVALDNIPGRDLNRQVLVVHDNRLYTLMFVPAGEVYTRMEELYAAVTGSFMFPSQK